MLEKAGFARTTTEVDLSAEGFAMQRKMRILTLALTISTLITGFSFAQTGGGASLRLDTLGYFEKRGLDVLVFNNWYDGNFSDAKIAGIELIHHGVRTATNGDVRLSPTPGQWDPIPHLVDRKVNMGDSSVEVRLSYPDYGFSYMIEVKKRSNGVLITVNLDKPLPVKLEGRAGFNLEFLPSAYFEKSYLMDGTPGGFPLYPDGPMERTASGTVEPKPLAVGRTIVLAPDDSLRMVTIKDENGQLSLYDGRNLAQNGWFVVRSLIPSGKSGTVVKWFLDARTIPDWIREPVIEYSQVGYAPSQRKVAVFEFDVHDRPLSSVRLMKVTEDGKLAEVYEGNLKRWGKYLRYDYSTFDFSRVKQGGLYAIEYGNMRTQPFRIADDVYRDAWRPTLDVFFPVQMDHMFMEWVFAGLNYIYGCHPGSNISFVSDVGTVSKRIAYGNNRADFTFIAGGVVPGDLILKPDFPENKEDWPFLWGASYIFLANAANALISGAE